MAFAKCHTPIGIFGPTARQRCDKNQRGSPHEMMQQHNSLLFILSDENEVHGSAAALHSLVTRSVAADPIPVSMLQNSSSWASPLLAANHVLEIEKLAVEKSRNFFMNQDQQHFRSLPLHQHSIIKNTMTNVLSQASSSVQPHQQQQQHHHLHPSATQKQSYPPPHIQKQPPDRQHVMASTANSPLTEHSDVKFYQPIAPLGEAPLPLQEIQAGVMGFVVGLLPGKRFKIMNKYLPSTEKQRRASKEDLSGLTEEERANRRKIRAQVYNRSSRHRRDRLQGDLRSDVSRMRIYKNIVDHAPDIMCVISPDFQCQVLYINKAAQCVLHIEPNQLLGSSFWNIVHMEDKMALFRSLTSVTIFKSAGKMEKLCCRVVTNSPSIYVSVRMMLANGIQGIICVMYHDVALPANLCVSPN